MVSKCLNLKFKKKNKKHHIKIRLAAAEGVVNVSCIFE